LRIRLQKKKRHVAAGSEVALFSGCSHQHWQEEEAQDIKECQ
jgi:hypothetical protein